MKTSRNNIIGTALLSLTIMSTITAQKEVVQLDEIGNVERNEVKRTFKELATQIAFRDDFKYRRELRKSRASKNRYHFSDTTISETEVLKHFKRAARKSESSGEFEGYFSERNLDFINTLDRKTVSGLYLSMRRYTLNGYLDGLRIIGSL